MSGHPQMSVGQWDGTGLGRILAMPCSEPDSTWTACAALAEIQDAVVTRSQLEQLGLPLSTAAQRCQRPGPWQRVLPGIVVLHNGPLSLRQRLRAGLLYAGPDSMLTGAAALRLHGIRRHLEVPPVHVLVPDQRQRTSSGFVLVERTVRFPFPKGAKGSRLRQLIEPSSIRLGATIVRATYVLSPRRRSNAASPHQRPSTVSCVTARCEAAASCGPRCRRSAPASAPSRRRTPESSC